MCDEVRKREREKEVVSKGFLHAFIYYLNRKMLHLDGKSNRIQMENGNTTDESDEYLESVYYFTYIILLIVEIISIGCILIILSYFFNHWHSMMKKSLHNHVIFLLILVSLFYITFDLPFIINHYRLGYDYYRKPLFCFWWYWIDYTLVTMSLFLTATASIQRHILVFHSYALRIRRKRWFLHFIPLIVCVMYPSLFYFISICFYPCKTSFDNTDLSCPFPCYTDVGIISYADWIFHTICPLTIIVIANIMLICRVIYSMKKIRQKRSRTWKKQKKLTLQLLAFSTLYIMGWSPSVIISIIKAFFLTDLYVDRPELYYINNSSYFVCPLQPMICFLALPELMKYMKMKLKTKQQGINSSAIGRSK